MIGNWDSLWGWYKLLLKWTYFRVVNRNKCHYLQNRIQGDYYIQVLFYIVKSRILCKSVNLLWLVFTTFHNFHSTWKCLQFMFICHRIGFVTCQEEFPSWKKKLLDRNTYSNFFFSKTLENFHWQLSQNLSIKNKHEFQTLHW